MKLKQIETVESCPHCGGTMGYYERTFMSGWIQDNTLFERDFSGNREKYNHSMYDGLENGKRTHVCYCVDCNKAIGTSKETSPKQP